MTVGFVARAVRLVVMTAFVLWALPSSEAAAQCGGTQLCSAGAGDCTVSSACTITLPPTGLVIDLGSRRLVITRPLTINGPGGAGLTVKAGDFLLDGSDIFLPGSDRIGGTLTILSATNVTVRNNAVINANNGVAGGIIDLQALGGNVDVNGRLTANGNSQAMAFGGEVTLLASGSITVNGARVDVSGGDLGGGGSITIEALTGSLSIGAPLVAFGADGGDIDLSAGTTLQTLSTGTMSLNGTGDGGAAGALDLSSVGTMIIGGMITGDGAFGIERAGGDGTDLDVFTETGDVTFTATMSANAASGGVGGTIDISSGGAITLTRPMLAQADGPDGSGGEIFLTAVGTVSLQHQLDVRGRTGRGGSIDVDAGGNVTTTGLINADGDVQGGTISLAGCAVTIQSSSELRSLGPGTAPAASNTLSASSTMSVAGALKAGTRNRLEYRQLPAPSVTGPVTPAATLVLLPTLPCCIGCPTTTTTTSTSTTSTTGGGGSTTTTIPSICGNGVVTGAEQCDDGNTVGGDCCSATCTFEAAGAPCATDANPCTRDVCSGTGACTHPAGNAGTSCRAAAGPCDQAESCTGTSATCPADVKLTSVCRPATGPCDVAESCDGVTNTCPADAFAPSTTTCRGPAGPCDIAETCPGGSPLCPPDQLVSAGTTCRAAVGTCDVAEACTGSSGACPADGFAPNGTPCGADACTTGSGSCQGGLCSGGTPIVCGPCESCTPTSGGCVPAPKSACRRPAVAARARFRLKDSLAGPRSDLVHWRWLNGPATALAEFGNPVASDDLTLCVFDQSAATPALLFRADVPAGGTCGTRPCWVNNGRNIRYKNRAGAPDGTVGVVLVPGQEGRARIQFKGKGELLTGRPFGLPTPPLSVPLTVQLQSETGACWEASYPRAGLRTNDTQTFDAVAE